MRIVTDITERISKIPVRKVDIKKLTETANRINRLEKEWEEKCAREDATPDPISEARKHPKWEKLLDETLEEIEETYQIFRRDELREQLRDYVRNYEPES